MRIRDAEPADAAVVAAIYRHHVLTGTGTFEEVPPPVAEMAVRIAQVAARGWPWLVAEVDGAIVGYAYAMQLRDRAAYAGTCEDSVYVAEGAIGRGVGRALLDALMPAAARAGFGQMVAVIGDSANAGSIRLHAAAGFAQVGVWHGVGVKFGRVLDVVHMQRAIGVD